MLNFTGNPLPLTQWCDCSAAYVQGFVSGMIYTSFGIAVALFLYHLRKKGELGGVHDTDH